MLSRASIGRRAAGLFPVCAFLALAGCHRGAFPDYPDTYREFAYVSDGSSDSVAVLDLVSLHPDRPVTVGHNPTGMAANPVRPEVYVVNTGSDSISVIDTRTNTVAATIGVHRTPYFLAVSPDGARAYVPNSASNTVSVLDLTTRRQIAEVAAGESPGIARVSADNHTLVVSNRAAGSVSIYSIGRAADHPLQFRSTFNGCPGATDVVLQTDSAGGGKAFIACSAGHQVMVVSLAAAANSWRATQDSSLTHDALLTLLDVGKTPTSLALKPDGGEVFATNFDSGSVSEISTWTNEVSGTFNVGSKPTRAIPSRDDASLWISNFGADSAVLYSIADGRLVTGIHTGSSPDAMAFSADEHLLLVTNSGSGDVSVIRGSNRTGQPSLFTLFPAGRHPNDIVVKATEPH